MGTGARTRSAVRWKTRAARPADAPAIFGLLRELARYEKLTHTVTGSAVMLGRHMSGARQPRVYARVAEADGKMVGYTLCFKSFSSFRSAPLLWLEDLYVSPSCRRLGIGDRLLRDAARLALRLRCDRLDWWVLAWNEPALRFYRSIGASGSGDERLWRLRGAALSRFARGR